MYPVVDERQVTRASLLEPAEGTNIHIVCQQRDNTVFSDLGEKTISVSLMITSVTRLQLIQGGSGLLCGKRLRLTESHFRLRRDA